MARPTPAILRAASILNLLAAHPRHAFTLTDFLKAIPINKATLHSVLAALEDIGYVYRANDKSYLLGPALIRVARIAKDGISPLQVAMPEMRVLADTCDAVCSAVFRNRDELVVRERAASVSHLNWTIAPNTRFALRPPFGSVFMAWATKADIDRWLKKVGPIGTQETERELKALEFPRAHGFACGIRKHEPTGKHDIETSSLRLEDTEFFVSHLDAAKKYPLAFLAAPVFDDRKQVAFALVLIGFAKPETGRNIERMGQMLRAACNRITAAIGGEMPDLLAPPPARRRTSGKVAAAQPAAPKSTTPGRPRVRRATRPAKI